MATEAEPLSDARQTLLRALDHLDETTRRYGEAQRTYLVVVYAHQVEGQTIRGWTSTDDPPFVTAAMLREVAEGISLAEIVDADDGDEDADAAA